MNTPDERDVLVAAHLLLLSLDWQPNAALGAIGPGALHPFPKRGFSQVEIAGHCSGTVVFVED